MALTSAQIQADLNQLDEDIATLHQIVQGDAFTTVPTDSGPIDTIAKLFASIIGQTLPHVPSSSLPTDGLVYNTTINAVSLMEHSVDMMFSTPLGPSANPAFSAGRRAFMLDENIISHGNIWWLWSFNSQVFPVVITISNTAGVGWIAGDIAHVRFNWDSTTLDYQYTVQVGDTNQTIAQNLVNIIAADTTTMNNNGFFVEQPNAGTPPAYFFHFNIDYPYYAASPTFTASQVGASAGTGTMTFQQAINNLDTPGASLIISRAVNGRNAVANDLIGNLTFYGQSAAAVGTQLQQIYANIQGYIDQPTVGAPVGRLQFQMADPGANNVINKMSLRTGLYLYDSAGNSPAGGVVGDMGSGTVNVPASGKYFIGGVFGPGTSLGNFANDSAAGSGGVNVGGWYRNGSVVMVRVT